MENFTTQFLSQGSISGQLGRLGLHVVLWNMTTLGLPLKLQVCSDWCCKSCSWPLSSPGALEFSTICRLSQPWITAGLLRGQNYRCLVPFLNSKFIDLVHFSLVGQCSHHLLLYMRKMDCEVLILLKSTCTFGIDLPSSYVGFQTLTFGFCFTSFSRIS